MLNQSLLHVFEMNHFLPLSPNACHIIRIRVSLQVFVYIFVFTVTDVFETMNYLEL